MPHATCIIFDSHKWDDFVRFNLSLYSNAVGSLCDFFVAYHQTSDFLPDVSPERLVTFTNEDIFETIAHSKLGRGVVVPGNADLSFLAICRLLKGYDTYIRIEYDVMALADLSKTLEKLIQVTSGKDLGGSYFGNDYESKWMWWPTLEIPNFDYEMTKNVSRRAFFPIMSMSKEFVETYRAALEEGWRGHFEALAPTIANFFKCSIVDFSSGQEPFTKFPHFQATVPQDVMNAKCAFVHPVKTLKKYEEILKLRNCPPPVFGGVSGL